MLSKCKFTQWNKFIKWNKIELEARNKYVR